MCLYTVYLCTYQPTYFLYPIGHPFNISITSKVMLFRGVGSLVCRLIKLSYFIVSKKLALLGNWNVIIEVNLFILVSKCPLN